jgi:organic hydroperoxide reductase OsmC/OhrA
METAEAQCFISNSVKSNVKLIPEFVVARSPN